MKYIASGVLGAVIGALAMYLMFTEQLSSQMITVHRSPVGLEETVAHIQSSVAEAGWKMPKVYDLQQSLAEAGYDIPGIRVLSLCNPHHANRLLGESDTRFVSAMMPCRLAVYEHEGETHIAAMNVAQMSGLFGESIEQVMTDVAAEQTAMLQHIMGTHVE